MIAKLADLTDRFEKFQHYCRTPRLCLIATNLPRYPRKFAEIEPVVLCYQQVNKLNDDLEESSALLDDDDADLRELAEQEIADKRPNWNL